MLNLKPFGLLVQALKQNSPAEHFHIFHVVDIPEIGYH